MPPPGKVRGSLETRQSLPFKLYNFQASQQQATQMTNPGRAENKMTPGERSGQAPRKQLQLEEETPMGILSPQP